MTNQEKNFRHFDTFSGYAGFTLGIKQAYEAKNCGMGGDRQENNCFPSGQKTLDGSGVGHQQAERPSDGLNESTPTCIGFSEIEKHPIAVLKYHFPNIKNYGDITKIDTTGLPDFDLLTGGSPCQDLSVAGKQAGLSGERSGLFFQYIRLLKEKQPKNYIWENVKGALSSSDGWDFARVQIEMAEAGYSFQWQILNAKYFGVPQNRERVFVIGSLGDRCEREVFFEQTDGGENLNELTQNASQGYRVYGADGISTTIASGAGGVGAKTGLYQVCPTIRATEYKGGDNQTCVVEREQRSSDSTNSELARTIRVGGAGSPHGSKQNWDSYEIEGRIRRLTPTECERLMGLPEILTITTPSYDYFRREIQSEMEKESTTQETREILRALWEDKEFTQTSPRHLEEARGNTSGVWFVSSKNTSGSTKGELCSLQYYISAQVSKSIKTLWEKRMSERVGSPFGNETVAEIDGWTKYGIDENGKQYELSDSARYKLCGNGVVVPLVKAISKLM